jgi:hypothetical protein
MIADPEHLAPARPYLRIGIVSILVAIIVSGAIAWPVGVMRYAPLRTGSVGLQPAEGTSIRHGDGFEARSALPYQ